ncbi:MAG: hypothetical protein JWR84_3671 [Caulobacter sp.]|nr:hypothetical protein [Caulobacter sp.]
MTLPIKFIPAKAGTQIQPQCSQPILNRPRSGGWVPAFAGMNR